ncbi:MAG TPA: SDR family oxidoreductase [Cytophagaceae bacterium]
MSKVIIVTGASSGLGNVIADYLAGKGHIVYGTSRSIKEEGQKFKALRMDVCNSESVQEAVDKVLKEQGKIDVVINNAGIGIAGAAEHLQLEDVQRVFDTNVLGVLRVCQAVLPSMRERRGGKIINISSIGSELGLPYRGGYSASKAALDRLTEAMRVELKPFGIQLCLVQPGGVATDINKNRVMTPMPEDSPYRESFERCYDIINASVSKGLSPHIFGPAIEDIIKADKLKRVYRIGKTTEKLSVLVKKLVPSSVFDNILINHYKLDK